MKKMMSLWLMVAVMVLGIMSTISLAQETPEKIVKMEAWCYGSPAENFKAVNIDRAARLLNRMLEAAGSNVRVDMKATFEHVPSADALKSKITAAYEAGQLPDILGGTDTLYEIRAGFIMPVGDYLTKYEDLAADIPYSLLWRFMYRGNLYGLSADSSSHTFYFRKDVLRQLGWDEAAIDALPEKIRKGEITWYDISKIAEEAKAKGLVKWGIYHRPNPGGSLWIPYYTLTGGNFYDVEEDKMVLDKNSLLKMYKVYYQMTQIDKVLPSTMIGTSWRKIHTDFINGRVLFWMGGCWQWGEWQRVAYHEELGELPASYAWENIGFSLYPAVETWGNPGVNVGTTSYVIPKQSKHPELAFLIALLASQPAFEVDHNITSGKLPLHGGTRSLSKFKEEAKFVAAISYFSDYALSEWMPHEGWIVLPSILVEGLTKVEQGELTPEKAVDLVVARAKAELGDEIIIK